MAYVAPKGESLLSRVLFRWCERAYGESERRGGKLREEELCDLPEELRGRKWQERLEKSWQLVLESQPTYSTSQAAKSDNDVTEESTDENFEEVKREKDEVKEERKDEEKDEEDEDEDSKYGLSWLFGSVLFRSLWRTYKWLFFQVLSFLILGRICLMIAKPYLMTELIKSQTSQSEDAQSAGVVISLLMLALLFSAALANEWNFYVTDVANRAIGAGVGNMVFAKVLRLSSSEKRRFTVGEINNMLTSTIPGLANELSEIAYKFTSVFNLVGNCAFLFLYAGWSSILAVGLMGSSAWISASVLKKQEKLSFDKSDAQDKKMSLFTQMLRGIKVIKLHAWEKVFGQRLESAVARELELGRRELLLNVVASLTWDVVPMLALALMLTSHLLAGDVVNFLRPDTIFGVLVLIYDMRFFLDEMPQIYSFLSSVKTAVRKLEPLLLADEIGPGRSGQWPAGGRDATGGDVSTATSVSPDSGALDTGDAPIEMSNASFAWNKRQTPGFALKDISVRISRGQFVAVVGKVASGKSAFLSAILGEMELVSGHSYTGGAVAYVPQEAWLLNDTIKANILFGQEFDHAKYKRVLRACALDMDLDQFPAGDDTLLGEKGVNLSGGQKQRISMARAAYSGADLILLDDPLSAVDADVGQHIFQHLLGPAGLLRETTRVMVTHGRHWLDKGVDQVLWAQMTSDLSATVQQVSGGHSGLDRLEVDDQSRDEEPSEQNRVKTARQTSDISSEDHTGTKSLSTNPGGESEKGENDNDDDASSLSYVECLMAYLNFFQKKSALTLVLLQLASVSIFALSGVSLQAWSDHLGSIQLDNNSAPHGHSHSQTAHDNITDELEDDVWDASVHHFSVFLSETVVRSLLMVIYQCLLAHSVYHSTKRMSSAVQDSVLRSPMKFFETTPIGKIALRFGHDVNEVGHGVPVTMEYVINAFFGLLVSFSVVCFACPETFALLILVIPFMYATLRKYLAVTESAQELVKKYEDIQYSRAFETVEGTQVIRAFGHTSRFTASYEQAIDQCGRVYFNTHVHCRWMSSRLVLTSSVFAALSALVTSLCSEPDTRASRTGLAITYALEIGHNSFFFALVLKEAIENFASVARLVRYTSLPCEAEWERPEGVPAQWLTHGKVVYRDLCVSYRDKVEDPVLDDNGKDSVLKDNDEDLALKDISLTVMPGEKIGVVGRTGAGKTTLVLSLFRLQEARRGAIFIDDVDISTLGLHQLRSKVGIIPQDPVLFTGSLRFNLDPYGRAADEDIWKALRQVDMEKSVTSLPGGLNYECEEGGAGLSLGQRQLLCMARALMRKCHILVLDEATSSVDLDTDRLLQSTIRHEFSPCTVFTIAHRIDTVMDYDRILVVDSGRVVEFDTPARLTGNPESAFTKLRQQSLVDRKS